MNITRTLTIAIATGVLHAWIASAQSTTFPGPNQDTTKFGTINLGIANLGTTNLGATNSLATNTNQDLLPVVFRATCKALDSRRGRTTTTRITEREIIAEAVGGSARDRTLTQTFALAYNAAADSLQVVDRNLQPVVDVLHFSGGAAVSDSRELNRFTFLFFPGQTNEFGAETNVIGSAVISERAGLGGAAAASSHARITGSLQYFLTGGNALGRTNAFTSTGTTNDLGAGANTNPSGISATNTPGFPGAGFFMTSSNSGLDPTAQVCVGTFVATRRGFFTAAGTTSTTSGTGATTNAAVAAAVAATNPSGFGITGTTGAGTITGTATLPGTGTITGLGTTIGAGTTSLGATGTSSGVGSTGTSLGFGTVGSTGTATGVGTVGTTGSTGTVGSTGSTGTAAGFGTVGSTGSIGTTGTTGSTGIIPGFVGGTTF